jgi:hypothetical protein
MVEVDLVSLLVGGSRNLLKTSVLGELHVALAAVLRVNLML